MSEQGQAYARAATLQSAVSATGNGEVFDVKGMAAVAVQVTGTFSATVGFEGSVDGTNFVSIATGATAAGITVVSVIGLSLFRTPVTWTSGTSVTVYARGVTVGGSSSEIQGAAAAGAAAAGNPVRVGGQYNTAAPTLDNGDAGSLELDVNGNLKVREQYAPVYEDNSAGVAGMLQKPVASATYAPSAYQDAGSVTKANIKTTAGNVYSVLITNANAAGRWLQIHNKATAPVATDVPLRYFFIPGGTAAAPGILLLDSSYFSPSVRCGTGIGWAVSTTAATFTDSATAGEHSIDINYV